MLATCPGIKDVLLLLLNAAWCLVTFARAAIARDLSTRRVGVVEGAIGARVKGAMTVTVVCDVRSMTSL